MAKRAKTPKSAKTVKTTKVAKPAAAPKQAANRLLDPKMKALFNQNLDQWQRLQAKVDAAIDLRKKFERENVKAQGFTIKQIKLADQISTPEGEAIVSARMTEEVLVHAYLGKSIGDQLGFMLQPSKPDPIRMAREEGMAAARTNSPAKPVFAPETDGYKAYMEGYHDVQGEQVRKGISKLDKSKAKTDAIAKAPAKPRGAPTTAAVKSAADRAEARAASKNGKDVGPPRGRPIHSDDAFSDEPVAGRAH